LRRSAVRALFGLKGRRLTLTNEQAYDLVINVAAGNSTMPTPSRHPPENHTTPEVKRQQRSRAPKPQIADSARKVVSDP
jgi:hypothetical protein